MKPADSLAFRRRPSALWSIKVASPWQRTWRAAMRELKEGLERLAQLAAPPDDAFDRLARKRSRTQRNRRVGAALLAFAVAGAGVGAALVALGRSGVKP